MKKQMLVLLVSLGALLSCGAEQVSVESEEPIGVFVEEPCPMALPEGLVEGESVRCGTVAVPEYHAEPGGRTLTLRAAVFPSVGENPSPDPFLVAVAGPGTSAIESVTPDVAGPLGAALLNERDVVLIDYRGLPLAEPDLMCPEIFDSYVRTRGEALTAEEFISAQITASAACRDRLRGDGVDLEAFNNLETAADIAMVMTALGYEAFNVYGTSAGTILAQHLLRDFPERLRSVILDSTVPAGRRSVHIEAAAIAAQMLDAVVGLCEADTACVAAYPDLRQEMATLVESYDREPLTVEAVYETADGAADLVLTGHRVAQSILMLNTQTSTVPLMPWYIHALAGRDAAVVKDFLWTIEPPAGNFSWALGTAIFCMEYSDFTEDEILFPGIFPAYEAAVATQGFGSRTIARTCENWALKPVAPRFKEPARSDVPVLLMAGRLDSLTPPSWAAEVAESLPNAVLFEVPGFAHSPTFAGQCPATMALQFLADPSGPPDSSCLAEMGVQFVVRE